ncbi:hypothetical protein CTA1_5932 [Colletotrichum tanaceti]|uniref:Xylanolytic transcriptional activator regulatory domain-containing protein n=1 Tax=Colletotrichum tanaceti TaxID=1306861 RepID=A0A4U6XDT5_9PEZI|nr:hypothetical protein CTA1_5932 [Colletotrichum tanaceti]
MVVNPPASASLEDSGDVDLTLNVPRPPVEGGASSASSSSSAHLPSSASTPATLASHAHQSNEGEGAVVEGDSSLAAHSVFATEFAQKAVSTESLQDPSLDLGETLEALSQIVDALKQPTAAGEMTYPLAKPIDRLRIQGLELPPIEKAVNTIRIARSEDPFIVTRLSKPHHWALNCVLLLFDNTNSGPRLAFPGQRLTGMAWIYDFMPTRRFPDLCLNVYFSDTYSDYGFIVVNGGLYSLFTDHATQLPAGEKKEYLQYARWAKGILGCSNSFQSNFAIRTCRENLETSLFNLPLHLPASSDVIDALLFGTFHAVEISKPSLGWTLASKASELCHTLGYHRAEALKTARSDARPTVIVDGMHWHQYLFWNVYYIDKSLSLRLGRASTIPDGHVTMPLTPVEASKDNPILPYIVLWIKTAKCQGQIYEKLYSPDSMTQPYHVRRETRGRSPWNSVSPSSAKPGSSTQLRTQTVYSAASSEPCRSSCTALELRVSTRS